MHVEPMNPDSVGCNLCFESFGQYLHHRASANSGDGARTPPYEAPPLLCAPRFCLLPAANGSPREPAALCQAICSSSYISIARAIVGAKFDKRAKEKPWSNKHIRAYLIPELQAYISMDAWHIPRERKCDDQV